MGERKGNRDQCQKGVPGQENEVHRQVGISALDEFLKKMRTVGLPETLPVENPAEQCERCVEPEQEKKDRPGSEATIPVPPRTDRKASESIAEEAASAVPREDLRGRKPFFTPRGYSFAFCRHEVLFPKHSQGLPVGRGGFDLRAGAFAIGGGRFFYRIGTCFQGFHFRKGKSG